MVKNLDGRDRLKFKYQLHKQIKNNHVVRFEVQGFSIRLLTMFVFAVVLVESTRGFINARQNVAQLSYAIAQINQPKYDFQKVRPVDHNQHLTIVASRNLVDEKDIITQQKKVKTTSRTPLTTAVLNYSKERTVSNLKKEKKNGLKPVNLSVRRPLPGDLKRHFGQHFNLDARKYSKYDDLFKKYSEKYFGADTDWRWFKVQAFVESGMRNSVTSRVGAVGVMQVMPSTFTDIKRVNRFFKGKSIENVEWNIAAGIFYNRWLMKSLAKQAAPKKRLQLMFASYNAGMSRVLRSVDKKQLDSNRLLSVPKAFPRETRDYLKKIDVLMTHYRGISYSKSLNDLAKIKQPALKMSSPSS